MNEDDFEGSLVLEKLATVGKVDEFFDAVDSDDLERASDGVYLFPRFSGVYLWGAGGLLTPSAELGYAWTYDDGLVVNLGISGMWNVYLEERVEHHTGPGGLLNLRIGYGW